MNQYRKGKVKSTPGRGVKQYLKPYAYKQWEPLLRVTACLLHNESASYCYAARLSQRGEAAAKASPNRAIELHGVDPKPGELPMARVKFR